MQKQIVNEFEKLNSEIFACRKCSRLVEWRENIAREKTKRFSDRNYWGKPVTGFGDVKAKLWIIGLAPAAHGANRTGRMFTGDRSGDFLFRALHKSGFANQALSESRDDNLTLIHCFISALVRCAPPGNKPAKQEFLNCRPYLEKEFQLLKNKRVILCLGQLAFSHVLRMMESNGYVDLTPRPKFYHGFELKINPQLRLITSYHPSQQNTFTGKLTEEMFDRVFLRIKEIMVK